MNEDGGIAGDADAPEDPNLITIGELQVRRKRRYAFDARQACKHDHLVTDDRGETVQCEDCQVYVSAYWALTTLAEGINEEYRCAEAERQQAAWEQKKLIRRKAARRIEQAWGAGMAPCCPHCQAPILPEDAWGMSQENMQMERARRAREKGEAL